MKKLDIEILKSYKLYKENTSYHLEGDLIVLSGVNGSGKSQLLKILSKSTNEAISRSIIQSEDERKGTFLEDVLLLSFRDNIDIGDDFGQYTVTYKSDFATTAWDYYRGNIKYRGTTLFDNQKRERVENGEILETNGVRNPSWRSIKRLISLIKENYTGEKVFQLSQTELESILPADFIWRDENDIISQVGNLFYIACCERANQQIECSKTTEIFNNEKWLKNAPWTILNQLFEELGFRYRFKKDYQFNTPYIEENPKLRSDSDIRNIADLSDGEKAILKLALNSLDEEVSKDIKLVLFDEYDAPLNPSLIEAFYHVIERFYVNKGIQVIIATHSPATISLAPEYANFYELFFQKNESPKIIPVNQFDYNELRVANKVYYDKIKNQDYRISELEEAFKAVESNCLFVEDRYEQIYKIAYLKTRGIVGITEQNLDEEFKRVCPFSIHGNFSSGGLYNYLTCKNTTYDSNNIVVCLFDFDNEGFGKFEKLERVKDNAEKIFNEREGSAEEGLYLKHRHASRYALMIPIPERLKIYVSEKTSNNCFIEIESLLSEEYLKSNPKAELRCGALPFYVIKDGHKRDFWKDILKADKKYFDDFIPLFNRIAKIFGENSLN